MLCTPACWLAERRQVYSLLQRANVLSTKCLSAKASEELPGKTESKIRRASLLQIDCPV